MKTALTTAMYLDGKDTRGNPRIDRTIKYLKYYSKLQSALGYDDIFFIDNASSPDSIAKLNEAFPLTLTTDNQDGEFTIGNISQVNLYRHDKHYEHGGGSHDYPNCWRAFFFLDKLIDYGYEKIICIDTDAYCLTKRLAHYTKEMNTGIWSLWCETYQFPESAYWVMNKDAFPKYKEFINGRTFMSLNGTLMEGTLPHEPVKDFKCGRYGEDNLKQTPDMDCYCQCPNEREMIYEMGRMK